MTTEEVRQDYRKTTGHSTTEFQSAGLRFTLEYVKHLESLVCELSDKMDDLIVEKDRMEYHLESRTAMDMG